MRPIVLEIEGLQSFRSIQRIDFETLSENGLFGIFGPTGSGKSTVLDAITLALYGRVKRAEGTQGIINTQEQQAKVSFTFELSRSAIRRCFRVERVYQRKKGSINQCEAKVTRLIEVIPTGEIPLCDKANEVTNRVQSLIGLGEKDFTRAVVLPQNSFQEFLLLNNKDRREMLERIFYLEEYGRELNEKLASRMACLKSTIDMLSGELKGYEDATDSAFEQANLAMLEATAEKDRALDDFRHTEKRFLEGKEVWSLVQESQVLQDTAQKLLLMEDDIDQSKIRLERAVQSESLASLIHQVQELETKLKTVASAKQEVLVKLPDSEVRFCEARQKLDGLKAEITAQQPKLVGLKARLEDALAIEAEVAAFDLQISHIEHQKASLQLDLTKLQMMHDQTALELESIEQELNSCRKQTSNIKPDPGYRQTIQNGLQLQRDKEMAESSEMEISGKIRVVAAAMSELKDNIAKLEKEIIDRTTEVEHLQNELTAHESRKPEDRNSLLMKTERLHGLKALYEAIQFRQRELDQLGLKEAQLKKSLVDCTHKLSVSQEGEKVAKLRFDACQRMFEQLQVILDQNAAFRLSQTLEEGNPCPVCGATHHPAPAHGAAASEAMQAAQTMEEEKYKLEDARKNFKEAENQVLIISEQIKSITNQLVALGLELKAKVDELQAERGKLPEVLRNSTLDDIVHELERMTVTSQERLKALEQWEVIQKEHQDKLSALKDALGLVNLRKSSILAELKINGENLAELDNQLLVAKEKTHSIEKAYQTFQLLHELTSAEAEMVRLQKVDQELHQLEQLIQSLSQTSDQKKDQISTLKQEMQGLGSEMIRLETQWSTIKNQNDSHKKKLNDLSPGTDIKAQISRINDQLVGYEILQTQQQEALERQEKEYRELVHQRSLLESQAAIHQESLEREAAKLQEALRESGFDSMVEAQQAQLTKEEQVLLKESVSQFDREKLDVHLQLQAIQKKLLTRSITEEEWHSIQTAYEESAALKETTTAKSEVAKNIYETVRAKHVKWLELSSQFESLSVKQSLYDQIQRLLRADRNKDNSFIDYIAEERLRYVAAKASETLGLMTRFKYTLELDAESGFRIRDNANGGLCRSVTSLSGGETFLTALALALALSEQIQLKGQSPLEFFFLDEGFGTLDTILLDTVMDALERLSRKERIIGLISHVPEMKSRIGRRLVVEPPNVGGAGSCVRIEKA